MHLELLSAAQRAQVAACALTAAEDAALFDADERVWGLWQIEAARLAQLDAAAPGAAAAARRGLAPAIVLCLATIYEDPWLACLDPGP
jgi:hypothetical protein